MTTTASETARQRGEGTASAYKRRLDALRGWVGCATLIGCAPAYSFAFTSFYHAKETALYGGLALAALLVLARGRFEWTGVRFFAPLWLSAALSLAVHAGLGASVVPAAVAEETARIAMLLLAPALFCDLLRSARWRRRFRRSLLASVVIVAGAALWQYVLPGDGWFPEFAGNTQAVYSVMANQDALGVYMALGASMLTYAAGQRRRTAPVCLAMLAVVLVVLLLSESRGAWLAALAGMLVALARTRRRTQTFALLLLAAVLASPMAYLARHDLAERVSGLVQLNDTGVRARLWFWDGATRMIRDHPAIGVGLGGYAYHSPKYQGDALHAPGGERRYHNELDTLYAHNEPLQLAAETGIAGSLLAAWMLLRLLRRTGVRAAEPAVLTALAIASLTYFPLHGAPFALWGGLAAMTIGGVHRRRRPNKQRWSAGLLLPVATWAIAAFLAWAVLWPSVLLARADTAARTGEPSLERYAEAVRHPWPHPWAHRNFGVALSKAEYYEEAADQFREALRGLDSGSVHLALGALAEWHGDTDEAARRLREAVHRIPGDADAWRRLIRVTPAASRPALLEEASGWLDAETLAAIRDAHTTE